MKGGVTMSDSSDSPIDPTGLASGKDEHIKPEWVQQLGLIFKKYKLTNHDYNVTLEIFNGALSSEVQQGVEKALSQKQSTPEVVTELLDTLEVRTEEKVIMTPLTQRER